MARVRTRVACVRTFAGSWLCPPCRTPNVGFVSWCGVFFLRAAVTARVGGPAWSSDGSDGASCCFLGPLSVSSCGAAATMASTRPDARIPEGVTNDVETASDDAARATRLARQRPRRPPEWLLGTDYCAPASADGAARAGVTINDVAKASDDAARATKATRLACTTENKSNSKSVARARATRPTRRLSDKRARWHNRQARARTTTTARGSKPTSWPGHERARRRNR